MRATAVNALAIAADRSSDVGVRRASHLLDVGTRSEHLVAAVEDDRAHGAVVGCLVCGGVQLVLHLIVERVHRGAIKPDGSDAVLDLEPDERAHVRPPENECLIRRTP